MPTKRTGTGCVAGSSPPREASLPPPAGPLPRRSTPARRLRATRMSRPARPACVISPMACAPSLLTLAHALHAGVRWRCGPTEAAGVRAAPEPVRAPATAREWVEPHGPRRRRSPSSHGRGGRPEPSLLPGDAARAGRSAERTVTTPSMSARSWDSCPRPLAGDLPASPCCVHVEDSSNGFDGRFLVFFCCWCGRAFPHPQEAVPELPPAPDTDAPHGPLAGVNRPARCSDLQGS